MPGRASRLLSLIKTHGDDAVNAVRRALPEGDVADWAVALERMVGRDAAPKPRAPRPRQKPKVKLYRPDPETADPERWLHRARAEAEERFSDFDRTPGKTTAQTVGYVDLDPQKIAHIPGGMDEVRVPGDPKYDRLRASVEKQGFLPDSHIWIGINHRGNPYILEGNTRAAVARDLGIPSIPANIMYYGGGEQVGGLMEPRLLEQYMPQSELMRDPAFRRYFEGSKAVDEYGEPLRFYHGTQVHDGSDFGNFSVFDRQASTKYLRHKPSMNNVGHWFSNMPDKQGAGMYAPDANGVMYPVYLNYKNPWEASWDDFMRLGNEQAGRNYPKDTPIGLFDPDPLRAWLKERGHDAIKFPAGGVEGDQAVTVVLDPTQIKSATGNRGTFDPFDPDITKARGGLAVKRRRRAK